MKKKLQTRKRNSNINYISDCGVKYINLTKKKYTTDEVFELILKAVDHTIHNNVVFINKITKDFKVKVKIERKEKRK